jgi:hypothetical protein
LQKSLPEKDASYYCSDGASTCASNNGNLLPQVITRSGTGWTQDYTGYDAMNLLNIAAGVAAILMLVAGAEYVSLHRPPKLTAKDTIVLAEFDNKTGDRFFDQTFRQGLAVQLEQSPFITFISEDRIQQVLHLMTVPAETRLTPAVAREICERTSSAAVLEGLIAGLRSQYMFVAPRQELSRFKSGPVWASRSPRSRSTPRHWSRQPGLRWML